MPPGWSWGQTWAAPFQSVAEGAVEVITSRYALDSTDTIRPQSGGGATRQCSLQHYKLSKQRAEGGQ